MPTNKNLKMLPDIYQIRLEHHMLSIENPSSRHKHLPNRKLLPCFTSIQDNATTGTYRIVSAMWAQADAAMPLCPHSIYIT